MGAAGDRYDSKFTQINGTFAWRDDGGNIYLVNIKSVLTKNDTLDFMGWVILNKPATTGEVWIVEYLLRNATNAKSINVVLPLNLDDKFMKWMRVDPWLRLKLSPPPSGYLSQRISWNQPNKYNNIKIELAKPQYYLDLLKLFAQTLTNCDKSYVSELSAPNQICPMIYLEPDNSDNPQKFTPKSVRTKRGPR